MQIRPMELEDIEQVVILENQTWDTFNTPAPLPIANKDKSSKILKMEHIILLLKKIKTF